MVNLRLILMWAQDKENCVNIAVLCLEPTRKCSRTLSITESSTQSELPLYPVKFLGSLCWWPLSALTFSAEVTHTGLAAIFAHLSSSIQIVFPLHCCQSHLYESQPEDSFLLRPHHTVSTMMKLLKPLHGSSLSFSLKTDSLIAVASA